jgi:hypothetical protein
VRIYLDEIVISRPGLGNGEEVWFVVDNKKDLV